MAETVGTGRASGKVILFGEHAVVHGRPALAAGLSIGCEAEAKASQGEADVLEVLPWRARVKAGASGGPHTQLRRAFEALLEEQGEGRPRVRVKATLGLPSSAGLGASAALSVAVVRALDALRGRERDAAAVAEASMAGERVFHGNPSGVDNAMAAHGGVALYTKAEGLSPVRVATPPTLVVGNSGQPGRTKQTVASVARQLERDPKKVGEIFDGVEAIVRNGVRALEEGNLSHLGQLMSLNQQLLNALLLSTTRLERMCTLAKEAGALGAKLTGGGGGGCMIALVESAEAAAAVAAALEGEGFAAFVTTAGAAQGG